MINNFLFYKIYKDHKYAIPFCKFWMYYKNYIFKPNLNDETLLLNLNQ